MAAYWAMRTYRKESAFIFQELKNGRLRQGWGYQPDQNLEIIRNNRKESRKLNQDQLDCWRGNRRMHPQEEDGIQKGDIIILPNLPDNRQWSVAKVTGDYRFQIDPEREDFGHIIEVELLNLEKPVNPYNKYVAAPLRATLKNRLRLWDISYYKEHVHHLLQAIEDGKDVSNASDERERLLSINDNMLKLLFREIRMNFEGSEFEFPIGRFLNVIYKGQVVEHTAGSSEKGADFICTVVDDLGVTYRVAVQVKMWEESVYSLEPLEQIVNAYENYEKITAGVIFTLADSFTDEFESKRLEIEEELKIPVMVLGKEETANLLLKYFPDIVKME